jgi:hypothetical protein
MGLEHIEPGTNSYMKKIIAYPGGGAFTPPTREQIGSMSLRGLQRLNEQIYGRQNRRFFTPAGVAGRLSGYGGVAHKAVRTEKNSSITGRWVAMTFSWTLALANHIGRDLEQEVRYRFPNVCPYCTQKPCIGKGCKNLVTPKLREQILGRLRGELNDLPCSLNDLQTMLAEIYPNNTKDGSLGHFSEEVGEVMYAIGCWMGTGSPVWFQDVIDESCDVFANLSAVATCCNVRLAEEMAIAYEKGCTGCGTWDCECGFPAPRLSLS